MSLDISLHIDVETGGVEPYSVTLFDANFTHNVTNMWSEAGIYDALYMSEGKTAGEVLSALRQGLADMEARPAIYRAMNSPNGWGTYRHALPWLRTLVAAFEAHPLATIHVWK